MSKQSEKLPIFIRNGRNEAVAIAPNYIESAKQAKKIKKEDSNFSKENVGENLNWSDTEDEEQIYNGLRNLPLVKYDGNIHYLRDYHEIAEAFKGFINLLVEKEEEEFPCAFDLEWAFDKQTNINEKVSVLQICIDLENCFIVQMSNLEEIPTTLIDFLYHPKVIINGLYIRHDILKLVKDFPIFNADILLKKCVDIGEFYNQVFNAENVWSLKRLTMHTIREQIDKSSQKSNWNIAQLSETQLLYASTDVYVSE